MPINVTCGKCRGAIVVPDGYAGRNGKCPKCAGPIVVPTTATDDDPFGFAAGGEALVNTVAGRAIDTAGGRDDAVTPEVVALRRESGWGSVIGGLNSIWIGSGIQALSVTTLVLLLGVLLGMGRGAAELAGAGSGRGDHLAEVLLPVVVGLVFLAGVVLRLVGFLRCLATPAGGSLVFLALGCELLALAGTVAKVGLSVAVPALAVVGDAVTVLGALLGTVLLLIYLQQIGVALAIRAIPARVRHFTLWLLLGGIVGLPTLIGSGAAMMAVAGAAGRESALSFLVCPGVLLVILTVVTVPLTLFVKYLGTLSLAADEIKRRTGRGRA